MSLIAAGIFLCSTIAYAGTYTNSTAGAVLTVGNTSNGDPAELTFNPSPGVSMGVSTVTNAYVLNALNTSITTGKKYANEYLVLSTKAGYYQKQTDTIATTATLTGYLTADPPTTGTAPYVYMGGGS